MEACPNCGRPLPPDGPAGLCPRCLLAAGLQPGPVLDEHQPQGGFPDDSRTYTPVPGGRSAAPQQSPATIAALNDCFPQLQILEVIGQGGMGTVYKARQTKLDRLVALKIILPEAAADPAFAERFHREARTLARLSHPHIVAVHDFGEVQAQLPGRVGQQPLFYLLMEYVDGTNLRQLLDGQPLPPAQALAIIPQICDALQFAHDEGVVHRDIKPENILIDRRGRVRIADFGLAKLVAGESEVWTLTGTHQVMGTLRYMAPEQMEGSRAVDHRADIYSLGVVFYEMLTGQIPAGHFEPPSRKTAVDSRLDSIVLKAMAREPERRFQQASQVRAEVEQVQHTAAGPDVIAPVVGHSLSPDRPSSSPPQTLSELLSREFTATVGWIQGRAQPVHSPPWTVQWLAPLLCIAALATLFLPWLSVDITDPDATAFADVSLLAADTPEKSIRREFVPIDQATGVTASLALAALLLLQTATAGLSTPGRRTVILRLLTALIALTAMLLLRIEAAHSTVTVYGNPQTGELPRHYFEYGGYGSMHSGTAWLNTLEHRTSMTPAAITGLTALLLLLALNAVSLRHAPQKAPNRAARTHEAATALSLERRLAWWLKLSGAALVCSALLLLGVLVDILNTPWRVNAGDDEALVALCVAQVLCLPLAVMTFLSASALPEHRLRRLLKITCILLLLPWTPAWLITLPVAAWCLSSLGVLWPAPAVGTAERRNHALLRPTAPTAPEEIRQDVAAVAGPGRPLEVDDVGTFSAPRPASSPASPPETNAPVAAAPPVAAAAASLTGPVWPGDSVIWRQLRLWIIAGLAVLCLLLSVWYLPQLLQRLAGDRRTPLLVAVQAGDHDLVQRLLVQGADPNESVPGQAPPLWWAVANGDHEIYDALLMREADVNAASSEGITPLMLAAARGDLSTVFSLIRLGARVNAQDQLQSSYAVQTRTDTLQWPGRQLTALMLAAHSGYREVARMLLEAKADATLRNQAGLTAAEMALRRNYTDVHDLILGSTRPPIEVPPGELGPQRLPIPPQPPAP